jgi:WD40 repeat protein
MKGGYSISLLKQFKENSPIYTLEPLDDRGTIVTGGKDPIIKVWCMKTLKTLGQIDTSPYYGVGFEMFLISKYDLIAVGFYNGAVILYDYRTLREFARVSKGIGENDHINTMAFIESKDLLCASVTDHVKFWKLNYEKKQFYEYKSLKYPEGRDGMAMIPFNGGKGLMCTNGSQKLFSINLSDWRFSELLSLDEPIGYVRINKRKRLMVVGLFADKVLIYNY